MAHNLSGIYNHRHCEEAEGRRGNPFSPPGAIFFLRSQKEYGKKNLPREGLVETAPPLEPTPVCISSHRHMPGDASAAYCGEVDGNFGSKTDVEAKKYQGAKGLTQDGVVGKLTWGKLIG